MNPATLLPTTLYIPGAVGIAMLLAIATKYLSTVLSHIGILSARKQDSQTTVRALPATYYQSDEVYELERRAIFAKKWILVTHKLRFPEHGSWVRFEEAGFSFFLVNNNGTINGFHNICRHRAFPIVTKDAGQSYMLSCKYHGWSYGLNGQLAKAPGYGNIKGFNKGENKINLFPIHVHIDAKGFIWVNMDASDSPEKWSAEFKGIDQMERHKPFNFEDYHFDHTWGMSGDYNWKTLADNYNECYHCKTAHPDAGSVADLSSYKVDVKGGNIEHFANTTSEQADNGLTIVSNYYFPNACMTVSDHFFYMMRCVPTSANHCSMEYEVYRHKDASDEHFKKIDEMFKRILAEDKWLCNNAQKNLNAGVFVNGEMHPEMEQGPLYFQHRVRELLQLHYQQERSAGKEINPAQGARPRSCDREQHDIDLCHDLACGKKQAALAW